MPRGTALLGLVCTLEQQNFAGHNPPRFIGLLRPMKPLSFLAGPNWNAEPPLMRTSANDPGLAALATTYGIDTTYRDIWGAERSAPDDALIKVLQSLGAPLGSPADAPSALRERQIDRWSRRLEPVLIAWGGRSSSTTLRIPASLERSRCACVLRLENGSQHPWSVTLSDLTTIETAEVDGALYLVKELGQLQDMPMGYHRFSVEIDGRRDESRIISAPKTAWTYAADSDQARRWGVFMPLHALRSRHSRWGGTLSDLEEFTSWTARMGGSLVGTLPLLATFLDEPFDPSPYSPASRLFWNELFLDLEQIPELASCPAAQSLLANQPRLSSQNHVNHVDYRAWSEGQRAVLEPLSACFFERGGERDSGFQAFLARQPRANDYAQFRAVQERQRSGWIVWPDGPRDGRIEVSDFDPARQRYHLYAQWQLFQQINRLADRSREVGARLYLDFPLGVHPDSYDTWRERASFANGISVGAPPDMFFTGGQNWGFPPMQPQAIRDQGYSYFIDAIRNHLRFAGALRIDHVMGLMRLFWIPQGMGAQDGVYVRFAPDEMYAILALESRRFQCPIVGEDLGTVPESVRAAMTEHDFLRMYVAQFEMSSPVEKALPPAPATSMASVNTHDTVLFGGFWDGLDIEIMRRLELIDDDDFRERREERAHLEQALLRFLGKAQVLEGADSAMVALQGILERLAAGPAQVLMVTLEDLWLEREPQNVPGTGDDWENWRRKARYSMEEFKSNQDVLGTLNMIHRARQTGTS